MKLATCRVLELDGCWPETVQGQARGVLLYLSTLACRRLDESMPDEVNAEAICGGNLWMLFLLLSTDAREKPSHIDSSDTFI